MKRGRALRIHPAMAGAWARKACLLALLSRAVAQVRPIPMVWSSKTFGPDGPWQAVQVTVGTGDGAAQVDLYPGGSFDSNVLTPNYCNGSTSSCAASAGGLYDPANSPTADTRSIGAQGSFTSWSAQNPMNMSGDGVFTLDTMTVGSVSTAYPIPNTVFSSILSTNNQASNGSYYPATLGNLALGSPNPVQTFLVGNGSNVTGQLLTGYLRNNNDIPSSSFGLHIGSAVLGQVGSLILGGFDQSRVSGDVGSFDTTGVGGEPLVNLIDVTIGVETGGTPFNTTTIPSLFEAGGNTSVLTSINPLVPYMFLPNGMCQTIARWLPVTFLPNVGLYAWNTNDYRYKAIITSPAYLSFTFEESETANLTIKVPFSLLNLTLESPIVAKPQPYFPCSPWNSPDAKYFLGRAFMQAAYLSINWEQNKMILGQATGPGSGPSSIQTINPSDTTFQASPDSAFLSTWQSKWTILPANASSNPANNPANSSNVENPFVVDSGLSSGAKIGIGVGVGVGVAAAIAIIISLICVCVRRRRRARQQAAETHQSMELGASKAAMLAEQKGNPQQDAKHPYYGAYGAQPQYRHELAVPPGELDAPNRIHEADPQRLVHEAPSSNFAHEIDSREVDSDHQSPQSAAGPSPLTARPRGPLSAMERSPVSPNTATLPSRPMDRELPKTPERGLPRTPSPRSPVGPRRHPEGMI